MLYTANLGLCDYVLFSQIQSHIPEDDEYWLLFLQMMEIVDLLLSPNTSDDHAVYAATLINEHHQEFCWLYPDRSIIPNMHFMVHMSRLMTQ